jgi:type 1 fimbriae regulatory protein FimB/type 1 fimbriae regulatory protein FimE
MPHAVHRLIVSNTENGTVNQPPRRQPNATVRSREYLTPAEVDRLIDAAKGNRWGQRDATAILLGSGRSQRPSAARPAIEEWPAEHAPPDTPMSPAGFRKMVARLGEAAGLDFPAHPHMLRHACGYKLANDGQDTRSLQLYLGHKNIQHTVRYTQLDAGRFKGFWQD